VIVSGSKISRPHGLEQPGVREGLLARTPMGRLGTVEDVTALIRHLASDGAHWVTGASLLVDGGQSIYGQPTWIRQDRKVAHEPGWLSGYDCP
jgi:NAD(P)-dependent dehydrogenase (short-subunit alcohol dehydrogenase family)